MASNSGELGTLKKNAVKFLLALRAPFPFQIAIIKMTDRVQPRIYVATPTSRPISDRSSLEARNEAGKVFDALYHPALYERAIVDATELILHG